LMPTPSTFTEYIDWLLKFTVARQTEDTCTSQHVCAFAATCGGATVGGRIGICGPSFTTPSQCGRYTVVVVVVVVVVLVVVLVEVVVLVVVLRVDVVVVVVVVVVEVVDGK